MEWNKLLSAKRFGLENYHSPGDLSRSEFQRDYDRIIFSSPFRRLQNKTQVFPLPGSVFVHNRLTHSLEVASIGRSMGSNIAYELSEKNQSGGNRLIQEVGSIVSAACLVHDMGNPPFGHSGEEAISNFFKTKGKEVQALVGEKEWLDLTCFEGNANAFRLLTHQFGGRRKGGFALTYSTLAAMVKYPFGSDAIADKKKYGFFQSEKDHFMRIAEETGMDCLQNNPLQYARHPLVYLVEAADDICYHVMDLEDAHKLKIFTAQKTKALLLGFYNRELHKKQLEHITDTLKEVTDANEQIAFLRAGVIGKLIKECTRIFLENYELIMEGRFKGSLVERLNNGDTMALNKIKAISRTKIYNHPSVVQIEISGYRILGTLLEEFIGAVLSKNSTYSKKILSLLPLQFVYEGPNNYHQAQSIVDYISGMTDLYALDLYRIIKGIDFPKL